MLGCISCEWQNSWAKEESVDSISGNANNASHAEIQSGKHYEYFNKNLNNISYNSCPIREVLNKTSTQNNLCDVVSVFLRKNPTTFVDQLGEHWFERN